MRCSWRLTARTSVCLLAGVVSLAHGAESESGRPRTTLYAGLEIANTDYQRLEAGASVHPNDRWRASLAAARSEFDLPGLDSASSVASARASYDFGSFGVGVGARRAEIHDVSLTRGWLLSGFVEHDSWRFTGEVEARDTELASAQFTDEEIPELGTVSGVASCGIRSVGYQGQATLTKKRWSAFASLRLFDYDDFNCALTIEGDATDRDNRRGRDAERRLAENTLDLVTSFSPRLIPREATLLESSLALGATMSVDADWLAGAEIYRDVERTGGDVFLTALAFADRRITDALTVEVWLGFAKASIEDSVLLGVRLTADL